MGMQTIKITRVYARNFRGWSSAVDLDDFTALRGPSGSGKSTVIQALKIALFGYDGERSGPSDLFRLHASPGAHVMACCVTFSNGTTVERTIRSNGKTVVSEIVMTPSNGAHTATEKQVAINALLGVKGPFLSTHDLSGRLASARERSDLLARLCPSKWDDGKIRKEIGAMPTGIELPGSLDIEGMGSVIGVLEEAAKYANAQIKESAAAARAHDAAAVDLVKAQAGCKHNQGDADRLGEQIAKANLTIMTRQGAAKKVAEFDARAEALAQRLEGFKALEPVDLDVAARNLEEARKEAEKERKKGLKAIKADITKAQKGLTKERAALEESTAKSIGCDKEWEVAKVEVVAAKEARQRADDQEKVLKSLKCPKCGSGFAQELANAKMEITKQADLVFKGKCTIKQKEAEQGEALGNEIKCQMAISVFVASIEAFEAKRDALAEKSLDSLGGVPSAKAGHEKALKLFQRREKAHDEIKTVEAELNVTRKRVEEETAASKGIDAAVETRDALMIDKSCIEGELKLLADMAASLKASASSAGLVEGLRKGLAELKAAKTRIGDTRSLVITDSLQTFVDAARECHVDTRGRGFAIRSEVIRNRVQTTIGVEDQDGNFYSYEQLSKGERLLFGAAFIIAVNAMAKPACAILIHDNTNDVSAELLPPLLGRIEASIKAGRISQAIVAGTTVPDRKGMTVIEMGG